jgi:hypothetical protein
MSGGREGVNVWGKWEVVDLNDVIKQNRSVLVFSGLWMTYSDLFDVWRVASECMGHTAAADVAIVVPLLLP